MSESSVTSWSNPAFEFVLQDHSEFPAFGLLNDARRRVQLCAFDILVEGDEDLRKLPLHLRKTNLERLLARRPECLFVNPFERGEIGPDLFRAACDMGLEGLVSKHWVKVKSRKHPAMDREL